MKFAGKIKLGEVSMPVPYNEDIKEIVLKDIELEYSCEHSIGEIKGLMDIIKQAPDVLVEVVGKLRDAEKMFTERTDREAQEKKTKIDTAVESTK